MKNISGLLCLSLLIAFAANLVLAEPIKTDSYSANYLAFLEKDNELSNHIKEISNFLSPEEQVKVNSLFAVQSHQRAPVNNTKNIVNAINYLDTLPSINNSGSFLGLKQSYNSVRNFEELSQYQTAVSNREVWSDYYWAFEKGGLANRYLSKEYREAAMPIRDPKKYCEFADSPTDRTKCNNNYIYGCRYNDDVFCFVNYLKQDIPKIQANIYNLSPEKVSTLSPAEKYDLLIGDVNFTLTYKHLRLLLNLDPTYNAQPNIKLNMNEVDPNTLIRDQTGRVVSYKKRGDYAGWMGICEGVATAQTQLRAARKTVILRSPLGFDIPFYPQDIRALSSYMYSAASAGTDANRRPARFFRTNMLGSRCNERKIRTLNNRIIDLPTTGQSRDSNGNIVPTNIGPADRCRDTAPSVLHIATVNSLGKMKRPFVMDSIPDDEVWNYPINEYSITYFNPQTKAGAEDILGDEEYSISLLDKEQAFAQNPHKTLITDYPKFIADRYKAHRSDYTYVVGVKLTIKYIDGAPQPHGQFGIKDKNYIDKNDERLKTMTFIYDLELDEDKNIIGGEWYPFTSEVQVTDRNGSLILDENGQFSTTLKPMFSLPDMIFVIPDSHPENHNLPLFRAERTHTITAPVFGQDKALTAPWRHMALEGTSTSQRSGQVLYNIISTMVSMSMD